MAEKGVLRFSIVTSGKALTDKDVNILAETIKEITDCAQNLQSSLHLPLFAFIIEHISKILPQKCFLISSTFGYIIGFIFSAFVTGIISTKMQPNTKNYMLKCSKYN